MWPYEVINVYQDFIEIEDRHQAQKAAPADFV